MRGFDPGRQSARLPRAVVVGGIVTGLAVVAIGSMVERSREIAASEAEVKPWTIVGPPCPPVKGGAFALTLKLDTVVAFDGVTFGRRFGHSKCGVVGAGGLFGQAAYPVCQFSSPAVLAVKTFRGTFYFEPGVGRPATVFAPDGRARCVLASPYWSAFMRANTESEGTTITKKAR